MFALQENAVYFDQDDICTLKITKLKLYRDFICHRKKNLILKDLTYICSMQELLENDKQMKREIIFNSEICVKKLIKASKYSKYVHLSFCNFYYFSLAVY
jgi:hypothetical protein